MKILQNTGRVIKYSKFNDAPQFINLLRHQLNLKYKMETQKGIGVFMVNNKGFSYWTGDAGALKSKSKEALAAPQKKKKQPEPKKEKTTSDEHVKPLAVAKNDNPDEKYPHVTAKDFYEDTYKFEQTAKMLDIIEGPDSVSLVMDRTVFHPQGGGQPKDKGFITSKDSSVKFEVLDLVAKQEAILHVGKYLSDGRFAVGDEVSQSIDGEFRKTNARIHSAGHLLDVAMNRAGKTELKPGKGYHFVEGPYVEYIGVVPEKERNELAEVLNKHCADLIAEAKAGNQKVFRKMCTYEEAQEELKAAGGVPPYVAAGSDLRVLKLVPEDLGCPCGGTHVHGVEEIGKIEITKIKKKKNNTQVSYKVIPPTA